MNWLKLFYLSLIAMLLVIGVWIYYSIDYGEFIIFSRDRKAIEKTEMDPLFGVETTQTEWVEGFWFGLLPGDDTFSIKTFFAAVPIGSFFLFLAVLSLFMNFRRRKFLE